MMKPVYCSIGFAALLGVGCNQSPSPEVANSSKVDRPAALAIVKSDPVVPPKPAEKSEPTIEPNTNPSSDGLTFSFPKDLGGKLLSQQVAPTAPTRRDTQKLTQPRERRLPAFLDTPSLPLAPAADAPPVLPQPKQRELKPTPLADRTPLDLAGSEIVRPEMPKFFVGLLAKLPSRDAHQPAELPLLSSRPLANRAPLEDPTIEFTAQSVISPLLPLRTEQAGFVRINLPDPFEHSEAARPRTPVVENPNRVIQVPPPPRK